MASGVIHKIKEVSNDFVNSAQYVDISSYQSDTNKYTCPSDGVISLSSYGGGKDVMNVNGVDVFSCLGTSDYDTASFRVCKGDKVYLRIHSATNRFFQFREVN